MRENKFIFNQRNSIKKETRNHSFSHYSNSIDKYKKDYNININIQNPNYKHLEIDYKKGNEKIILTTLPSIK
jgi:ribosomal protein L21E